MTKVKICGNTNLQDVKLAQEFGADYIGFIFTKSKRYLRPEDAKKIMNELPKFENYVGVFANQPKNEVLEVAHLLGLKWLQFHGEETSRYCQSFMNENCKVIKSFHVKDQISLKRIDEYNVSAFLFDTFSSSSKGGTGKTFNWRLVEDKPYVHEQLFLAGGLSVQNLKEAIDSVRPYAVDVATGVESKPGIKDPDLLKEFIQIAKFGRAVIVSGQKKNG